MSDTQDAGLQAQEEPDGPRPDGVRHRRHHRRRHLHPDRRGRGRATPGPSVVFSFVIAAVCCGLAALCYAEFASTVPVSGSAYTFSYATLGELVAWIIGWDLILELMLGASVVAQGWSKYFVTFLDAIGLGWPDGLGPGGERRLRPLQPGGVPARRRCSPRWSRSGSRSRCGSTWCSSAIKLFIVLFVIVAGLFYIKAANYNPFIPPAADPVDASGLTQPLFQWIFGFQAQTYGVLGHRLGGLGRVLRLHRLRRRGHHGRGGQATRRRTCRAASSARWSSARSSTWPSRW